MTTRKEQAARSKERLLAAAHELISKRGYDNVSILDITSACDMSVGNFYHYFKSKEELITALEREPFELSMENLLEDPDMSVLDMLCTYLSQWNHLMHDNYGPHFDRQWFIYHVSNPTDLSDSNNKINIAIHELTACLRRGIQKGELRADAPVDTIAESIAFLIFGMDAYFVMTDGQFNESTWGEKFCQTLLPTFLSPYYAPGYPHK